MLRRTIPLQRLLIYSWVDYILKELVVKVLRQHQNSFHKFEACELRRNDVK